MTYVIDDELFTFVLNVVGVLMEKGMKNEYDVLHGVAGDQLIQIATLYPSSFKVALFSQSVAMREMIETKVRELVLSKQKQEEVSAGMPVQREPTIQLKSTF